MNISPVSFGKAIEVIASYENAQKIAQAANNRPTLTDEMSAKVKQIFNDTDKGHAIAFSLNKYSEINYIFSGKESKEFLKAFFKRDLAEKRLRGIETEKAKEEKIAIMYEFWNNVNSIISKSKENYSIKISDNADLIEKIQ